jgi:hypothetical protein
MKLKSAVIPIIAATLSYSCSHQLRGDAPAPAATDTTGAAQVRFRPEPMTRSEIVAGGKCIARLTFDKMGQITNVETDPPCVTKRVKLMVNGEPLLHIADSITFGHGTQTCYGPPVPNPPWCVSP